MSISCATSKAIVSAPPPSSALMAPSGPRARPSLRFSSPLLFWFFLICLDSVSDFIFILMKLGFVNVRFLIWFFRSVSLVFFVVDWSFDGLGFTLALTELWIRCRWPIFISRFTLGSRKWIFALSRFGFFLLFQISAILIMQVGLEDGNGYLSWDSLGDYSRTFPLLSLTRAECVWNKRIQAILSEAFVNFRARWPVRFISFQTMGRRFWKERGIDANSLLFPHLSSWSWSSFLFFSTSTLIFLLSNESFIFDVLA